MVPAELQAGALLLLWRHCVVALVDVQGLMSLAVPDHRLVIAVIGQGLHVVWHLDGRKQRGIS